MPINEMLTLSLEPIPTPSIGTTYAVAMRHKLDRDYNFHRLDCLAKWLASRLPPTDTTSVHGAS